MHPVLILSYNGLPMLKKCVESVWRQDIETFIYFEDNNSKDGAGQWIYRNCDGEKMNAAFWAENRGVSFGWNDGLKWLFDKGADHVLVLNQDLILPTYFYRELLAFNVPFVTGFPVQTEFEISPAAPKPQVGLSPYPCFSAFLIRRECWEKVGPFDERYFSWCNDCSFHVEAHRLGIELWKSGVPFFHKAGSTLRNAVGEEQEWLRRKANEDRSVFKSIYGCEPGEPAYATLFSKETFGIRK